MILGGALGGFGANGRSVFGCTDCLEVTTNKLDILGDGSCIACYMLDGDATDLSGNYDGTATDVTYEDGKFGDSAVFNGSSTKIETSNDLSAKKYLTFSMWAKLEDSQDDYTPLFMQSEADTKEGIRITNKAKHPNIWNADKGDDSEFSDASDWSDYVGIMTHYVFVIDDTNATFCINGVAKETIDIGGNLKLQSVNTYNYYDDMYLNGQIDQVRIFNKALTADEVYKLYKENYAPKLPTTKGLVAHYPLTGTAEDTTGNNNATENSDVTYVDDEIMGSVYSGDGSIDIPDIDNATSCTYWKRVDSNDWTFNYSTDIPTALDTDKYKDLRIYNRELEDNEKDNIYLYEKNHRDIAVTNGLVAYYPLHNNSLDNWFNQYDGSDTDISYDGLCADATDEDNSKITCSTISLSGAWSNIFWIKKNTDFSNDWYIPWNGKGGTDLKCGIRIKDDDTVDARCDAKSHDTINDGNWHQVAISKDVNSTVIYIDNVLFTSKDEDTGDYDITDLTRDGGMQGSVSYMRIYNRAISEQEINDIYTTEKGEFQ